MDGKGPRCAARSSWWRYQRSVILFFILCRVHEACSEPRVTESINSKRKGQGEVATEQDKTSGDRNNTSFLKIRQMSGQKKLIKTKREKKGQSAGSGSVNHAVLSAAVIYSFRCLISFSVTYFVILSDDLSSSVQDWNMVGYSVSFCLFVFNHLPANQYFW